jgi:hypothetical protein
MDTRALDELPEPEVRRYLEFLLWHYRVVDAFWFLQVTEAFDQTTAERLNEEVWERAGRLGAKAIRERFGFQATGLRGLVEAQRLYPWAILIGYRFEEQEDQVLLSVPSCPVQEARLKRGLGEYACREMHCREFAAFAREVDPRLQVECLFAPPEPRRDGRFCQWRFTLAEEPREALRS